jgi:hypothetical protein
MRPGLCANGEYARYDPPQYLRHGATMRLLPRRVKQPPFGKREVSCVQKQQLLRLHALDHHQQLPIRSNF